MANYDCLQDSETLFYKFATDRNVYLTGDIRVSFYQATCPDPVHFLAQQVPSAEYEGQFDLRPWNCFSETHMKAPELNQLPGEQEGTQKGSSCRRWNPWLRISDAFFEKMFSEEIEEIVEQRAVIGKDGVPVESNDMELFDKFFEDQRSNMVLLKYTRCLLTKFLVSAFYVVIVFYNKLLVFFFNQPLKMNVPMSRLFGETISGWLRDEEHPELMYIVFAGWFAVMLQLLVSAIAWDYGHSKTPSVIMYAVSIPLLFLCAFAFGTLHVHSSG